MPLRRCASTHIPSPFYMYIYLSAIVLLLTRQTKVHITDRPFAPNLHTDIIPIIAHGWILHDNLYYIYYMLVIPIAWGCDVRPRIRASVPRRDERECFWHLIKGCLLIIIIIIILWLWYVWWCEEQMCESKAFSQWLLWMHTEYKYTSHT